MITIKTNLGTRTLAVSLTNSVKALFDRNDVSLHSTDQGFEIHIATTESPEAILRELVPFNRYIRSIETMP